MSRCLLLCIWLVAVTAGAEGGLWAHLEGQDSASGSFLQEIYDEQGELLERSGGHYAVLKPHFFRWEIDTPDRQLLLLNNGQLWHYDRDMATVTRRAADNQQLTPLQLLGADAARLADKFQVQDLGGQRYRLTPTYESAGFAQIEMHWDGEALVMMEVLDAGGQRMTLQLSPRKPAEHLTPDDFTFDVPEGVDFYDEGV